VKNLPVRPLAPRRKTPGQLNPTSKDLPGWVNKIMRTLKANTYIFAGIKSHRLLINLILVPASLNIKTNFKIRQVTNYILWARAAI